MSKRERQRDSASGTPTNPTARSSSDSSPWLARIAILVGLGVLIYMNGTALREARDGRKDVTNRIAQMEGRLSQLSTKVDQVARAAPPRSGPDPNRVYTIKTDGAAAQGPATAPVVIAEFSDFQ